MSKIPESVVREIADKTDIVAVIGERVRLERRGAKWLGLCPFHNEKTPSFNVDAEKGFFYCFGCRKGGDAITFLRELDKLSYREALEFLAEKAGVPLEAPTDEESQAERDRRALLELHERVAGTFRYFLEKHPSGDSARSYLARRGIDEGVSASFRLGYAPRDRRWLYDFLLKKGYSPDFLARSGLFAERHPGFPLFANRLLFPIADQRGRVIAFGGRLLEGEGPKYINSPETALFRKQESLFALDKAIDGIRKGGEALICEGYMDAISFHAAGVPVAVAPLGTAFTPGQAALLKRFARRLVFAFDADEAGQTAAEKAVLMTTELGLEAAVAILPGGKDASEILEKGGGGTLHKLGDFTINGGEFLLRRAAGRFDLGTVEGKSLASAFLNPYVKALDSEVKREAFVQEAARLLRTDPLSLRADFARAEPRPSLRRQETAPATADASSIRRTVDLSALAAVAVNKDLFQQVRTRVELEDIEDARARDLFIALEDCFRREDSGLESLCSRLSDPALRGFLLERAASGEYSVNPDRLVDDWLAGIALRRLERSRSKLRERIAALGAEGEGLAELQYELMHLDAEVAKLKGMRDERP